MFTFGLCSSAQGSQLRQTLRTSKHTACTNIYFAVANVRPPTSLNRLPHIVTHTNPRVQRNFHTLLQSSIYVKPFTLRISPHAHSHATTCFIHEHTMHQNKNVQTRGMEKGRNSTSDGSSRPSMSIKQVTEAVEDKKMGVQPESVVHMKQSRAKETELEKRGRLRRLVANAALGSYLLFSKTAVILKLTKMLPAASMVISSLAYSFVFGWPYAVGMVGQMFLHECGHAVLLHRYGIPFSPMVFVPFMGAVIAVKPEEKHNYTPYKQAVVAFGGPMAGATAASVLAVLGSTTESQLLLSLADFGFMINLFNLLPIGTLDGGVVLGAVSKWSGVAGLAMGGSLLLSDVHVSPIMYLIMLGGAYSTGSRFWFEYKNPIYAAHLNSKTSTKTKAGISLTYLVLVAFLLGSLAWNQESLVPASQMEGFADKVQETFGEYSWVISDVNEDDNEHHLLLKDD